jgi:hypothetical protein
MDTPDGSMPIGMALCVTWDGAGLAIWRLMDHGDDLAGRCVIVHREFRPGEGCSSTSRS